MCAPLAEANALQKSRIRNEESRTVEMAQTTTTQITEEDRQKATNKDGLYIKGGVGLALLMLFVSIGLYAYPDLRKSDAQIAQERAVIQQEECRQVFQAIGIRLSEGEIPDSTMSCPAQIFPISFYAKGARLLCCTLTPVSSV